MTRLSTPRLLGLLILTAITVFSLRACASGGGNWATRQWNTTGEENGWPERIIGTEQCLDAFSDQRCKAWYRAGTDPTAGAMWFLVAEGGDACAVDNATFTMAVIGEQFTCRWRHPR